MAPQIKIPVADFLARRVLRHPGLERALARACRNRMIRERLHPGAVALAYARVLDHPEIRVAELDDYAMHVNVADHLGIGPYFFGDIGIAWLTEALIAPGDTCVDVGANAGHYTLFMASRVGAQGRVYAFEANPAYVRLLRASIATNGWSGRVAVDARALWRTSGERLTFYISTNPSNTGTSSLVNHGVFLSEDRSIVVETTCLTDFAKQHGVERFGLVKVDVERAELQVLEGTADLLRDRRIHCLIVEMHAGSDAMKVLLDHGYSCSLIDNVARRLVPLKGVQKGQFGDFLCVSPRGPEHVRATEARGLA